MKKTLMFAVLLLLVAMAGCIDTGEVDTGEEKSLEDFFKENKERVSLTNETVIEGNYLVGRIKSVNETVMGSTRISISGSNYRRYHCFYTVIFEDGATLKTYNMGMFPYKIGGINGIKFNIGYGHPSIGCCVDKVIA